MTGSTTSEVEQYVCENEPLEQDELEAEFGRRGLAEVRRLMSSSRVSYTLDWKLHTGSERSGGGA